MRKTTRLSACERCKQILQAGRELSCSCGIASLRTEKTLRETGVARGALFHHFRSMTDALVDRFVRTPPRDDLTPLGWAWCRCAAPPLADLPEWNTPEAVWATTQDLLTVREPAARS